MLKLCQAAFLGSQDSQVLQRAIVCALQLRMPVPSGAGFTVPRASSELEAWTPLPLGIQPLRLTLPLLILRAMRTRCRPGDSRS